LGRRKSRELAIQLLYQVEMNKSDADHSLEMFWEHSNHPDSVKKFSTHLIKGVLKHIEEIDDRIVKTSKNWSLSRITPVDRSFLREAIFEMFYCPDIPYKVTLNEAIELGKKFGTEKSGSFINGVLDNVVDQHAELKKQVCEPCETQGGL